MKKILIILILTLSVNAHALSLGIEGGANISTTVGPSVYLGGSFALFRGGLELGFARDNDDKFTHVVEPYLGLQVGPLLYFFASYLEFGMPIVEGDRGYSIDLGLKFDPYEGGGVE